MVLKGLEGSKEYSVKSGHMMFGGSYGHDGVSKDSGMT